MKKLRDARTLCVISKEEFLKYARGKCSRACKRWAAVMREGRDYCYVTKARLSTIVKTSYKDGSVAVEFYASTGELMTLDHVVPVSEGGNHITGNMFPSLSSINNAKGSTLLWEFSERLQCGEYDEHIERHRRHVMLDARYGGLFTAIEKVARTFTGSRGVAS